MIAAEPGGRPERMLKERNSAGPVELVGTDFPRVGSWREVRQGVCVWRGEEDPSRWQGGDRQLEQGWWGGDRCWWAAQSHLLGTTEGTKMCSGTGSKLESIRELAWDPRKGSEK